MFTNRRIISNKKLNLMHLTNELLSTVNTKHVHFFVGNYYKNCNVTKMPLLDEIPFYWKYIYKIIGIIQFPTEENASNIVPHLWPLPQNCLFIYICVKYYVSINHLKFLGIFYFVDALTSIGTALSLVISITIFIQRSRDLKKLLLQLKEIKIDSVHRKTRSKANHYLRIILIITIFYYFLFIPFESEPLFYTLFFIYPGIILLFDHIFLSDILEIICNEFEQINREIKYQTTSHRIIFKTKKINDEEINDKMVRAEQLSLCHCDLTALTLNICHHFETTIIVAMITSFNYVTSTVYFLIYFLARSYEANLFVLFGNNFAFLSFYVFWLLLILEMFTRTEKEANITGRYIHDIWNKFEANGNMTKKLRHLQLVSIRFLNNKLEFRARNFFRLDWSFCHTMIAAITTYVIILVQFHI
nr:PREDICTED: uncharacterized protein LOC107398168 isoform X2 [Tribolium castaneum]|eukprot:XP_015836805.1 PREDICTED: uncharacterized protein LOC107398168 isoform X2 [Tribolium castaneum]